MRFPRAAFTAERNLEKGRGMSFFGLTLASRLLTALAPTVCLSLFLSLLTLVTPDDIFLCGFLYLDVREELVVGGLKGICFVRLIKQGERQEHGAFMNDYFKREGPPCPRSPPPAGALRASRMRHLSNVWRPEVADPRCRHSHLPHSSLEHFLLLQ